MKQSIDTYLHRTYARSPKGQKIYDKVTGKSCIVILDNARFHRMKHLQELANNTKYKHIILPLPPYSPELNPIEHTWATIKKWLRCPLSKFESIEGGLVSYFGLN